jgi:hypothetical protein
VADDAGRLLPSGKWQATVRDRSGKRHTTTDPFKTVVRKRATDQEAAIARGVSVICASATSRYAYGTSG